jgi:hypothetical protein
MTRGRRAHGLPPARVPARRGHEVDLLTLAPAGHRFRDDHLAWLESRCRGSRRSGSARPRACARRRGGSPAAGRSRSATCSRAAARRGGGPGRGRAGHDLAYAYYIRSAEALLAAAPVRARHLHGAPAQPDPQHRAPERRPRRGRGSGPSTASSAPAWGPTRRPVAEGEPGRADRRAGQGGDRGRLPGARGPPDRNVVWGPHGVDVARFAPAARRRGAGAVAMSGVMRYAPNVEAALWFAREVWPLVSGSGRTPRFYLVGRDPDPKVQALHGRDGRHGHGHGRGAGGLDRQGGGLRGADPGRGGAAEQAARGARHGQGRGRHARGERGHRARSPGRDLLLAGEPAAFAGGAGPARRPGPAGGLGRAGRRFVEERWTWEGPFLGLEAAFYEALAEAGTVRRGRGRGGRPRSAGRGWSGVPEQPPRLGGLLRDDRPLGVREPRARSSPGRRGAAARASSSAGDAGRSACASTAARVSRGRPHRSS